MAQLALANPDLPQEAREMAKGLLDKSEALLSLQDAQARKEQANQLPSGQSPVEQKQAQEAGLPDQSQQAPPLNPPKAGSEKENPIL